MTKPKFTVGSGNVFVDLGFEEQEAEELLLKANLFQKLQDAVRATNMTQVEVASLLGTDQSKISKILCGKISDFSIDRITSYLLKLRWDVRVDAHPAPPKAKRGRVIVGDSTSSVARKANVSAKIANVRKRKGGA